MSDNAGIYNAKRPILRPFSRHIIPFGQTDTRTEVKAQPHQFPMRFHFTQFELVFSDVVATPVRIRIFIGGRITLRWQHPKIGDFKKWKFSFFQ